MTLLTFLLSPLLLAPPQGAAAKKDAAERPPDPATAMASEKPFARPFRYRNPSEDGDLSKNRALAKLLQDLTVLQQNLSAAADRAVDEDGRPTCASPHFQKLRDELRRRLARQGGALKWLLLRDRSTARRRACYFGALFLPETQDTLHLLRYPPHEPRSALRHEAIRWAIPFLEKQLPLQHADAGGKPRGAFVYEFHPLPWVDLTRAPLATDRALAYDVLAIFARARPEQAPETALMMAPWMADNLRSRHATLRAASRRFVTALEPEVRMPDDDERSVELWNKVLRLNFPDIHLRGGLCDLYPGPDLDRLVEVGETLLRRSELGRIDRVALKTKLGTRNRIGIRLRALPPPLDRLGLEEGDLLTALNGTPIASCGELLKMIEQGLDAKRRSFLLEWVDKDNVQRARQYRLAERRRY